jgi:nucleoside-diphosphate-sugar epimerase
MNVIVVGATGTIGSEVAGALESRHDVVRASRTGDPRVDLTELRSIAALAGALSDADAVVCCAASAPLTPLEDEGFFPSLQGKLLGQVELARTAIRHLRDVARSPSRAARSPTRRLAVRAARWSTPGSRPSSRRRRSNCRAGCG